MDLNFELYGTVSVDSGEISISDPCHVGKKNLGVRLFGFGGDGKFSVYVRRGEDGVISEAKIVFEEMTA